MRYVRLFGFALVAIPVTLVAAQAPAGLNGRWIAVEPQKIAGHELVLTQSASILRVEQIRLRSGETYDEFGRRQGSQEGERESTSYRLDGRVLITKRGGEWVRSSLRRNNGRILLRDLYQASGVIFERSLSLDRRGRLVLEHRLPGPGDEPPQASERVLDVRRIVFERR